VKDLFKRLTREWGSKNRKADSRAHKAKLHRLSPDEEQELAVATDPELKRLGEDEVSTPYQLVEGPCRRR
jgi:hypothetical protein